MQYDIREAAGLRKEVAMVSFSLNKSNNASVCHKFNLKLNMCLVEMIKACINLLLFIYLFIYFLLLLLLFFFFKNVLIQACNNFDTKYIGKT